MRLFGYLSALVLLTAIAANLAMSIAERMDEAMEGYFYE